MVSRTIDSSPGGGRSTSAEPTSKTPENWPRLTSTDFRDDEFRLLENAGYLAQLILSLNALFSNIPWEAFRGSDDIASGASSTNSTPTSVRVGTLSMSTHPSLIEWKRLRFLIMDAPRANNLHLYLRELKKHNVTSVVRVCEPTYPASEVEAAGMQLLEMEYDDGGAPPPEIIHKWLDLVRTTFQDAPDSEGPNGSDGPAIAVHCVAGLGRAPVLVAIALIEHGKDPIKAVEYIRSRRRGAINRKQLSYLDNYERRSGGNGCSSCVVM